MSGGSMDYLYIKVEDASFREDTPLRRAFRSHLIKLAAALQAIEWNDSGDGDDREEELIREVLGPTRVLEQVRLDATTALHLLRTELDRLETTP